MLSYQKMGDPPPQKKHYKGVNLLIRILNLFQKAARQARH